MKSSLLILILTLITINAVGQRDFAGDRLQGRPDPPDLKAERRAEEQRAARAAEEQRQREAAEAKASAEAEQRRQANEKALRDQEEAAKARLAAVEKEASAEAAQKLAEQFAAQAKKNLGEAIVERERAIERGREIEKKDSELKALDAKLRDANEELATAQQVQRLAEIKFQAERAEQANKQMNLQSDKQSLEVWRAVLGTSALGLLLSNIFTYLNMRRELQSGRLGDELTRLQSEKVKLEIEHLKAVSAAAAPPQAPTSPPQQPATPP